MPEGRESDRELNGNTGGNKEGAEGTEIEGDSGRREVAQSREE